MSASYSKTDKELQTGSVQTKVYGMAERNSGCVECVGTVQQMQLSHRKHDIEGDLVTHMGIIPSPLIPPTVNIIGTEATS